MKRFVSSLLVAATLATSAPAYADELVLTTEPAVTAYVTPLNKGQPAPYIGVLLSPGAVAKLVAEKEAAAKALQLAVQHQADIDAAKLKFEIDRLTTTCNTDKKILQSQVEEGRKRVDLLSEQLQKETGSISWKSLGVGAGVGVGLTLLGVFIVGAAIK
mgnify:CR=1 FL=1